MKKERINPNTVPPSTPQGPERNMLLTDEAYLKHTWPGDDPNRPAGEGSGARTRPLREERPLRPTTSSEQASEDATVQHAANNTGSTAKDQDNESDEGMSGGLGGSKRP